MSSVPYGSTDLFPWCSSGALSKRACAELGIHHRFTRPHTPRTNGKAERFIRTALREPAYAFRYRTSQERAEHLSRWQHTYNWHRPHTVVSTTNRLSASSG
ncbi:MAG: transposase [Ectothiorhodospiraceae bacterium]|nr:transposase [Ectothiorhodospiraceae bacterium]